MPRGIAVYLTVVSLFLAGIGWTWTSSLAESATPAAPPTVGPEPCTDDWLAVDVRPPDRFDAAATPVIATTTPDGTPTTAASDRELYLVIITLPPDGCIPFDAPGNQKDGAVVWIVQQGKVEYVWDQAAGVPPGWAPMVTRGDLAGNQVDLDGEAGVVQTLFPGDWVTQDRTVAVQLRNIGSDSAIILKAVYARSLGGGGGCGGDCR